MELFPDGGFVRLRSRVNGHYVSADRDWERVMLRPNGYVPVLNSVWRVEHWDPYVLLQNAAYGRYLSFTARAAPTGYRGYRTTQLDRNEPVEPHPSPWMWTAQRVDVGGAANQAVVCLRYFTCYLRADDKYVPPNNRVTADVVEMEEPRNSTLTHWIVRQVAVSPAPPQPLPITLPDEVASSWLMFPYLWRTIRHVRASDEEGGFDQNHNNWPTFAFFGTSMISLRQELGHRQHDWNGDMSAYGYTLCMRPGLDGQLMPLITDLPRCLDPMNIVVIKNGTPAAAELVYPEGLA